MNLKEFHGGLDVIQALITMVQVQSLVEMKSLSHVCSAPPKKKTKKIK